MADTDITTKACSRCGDVRPCDEFVRKSGVVTSTCKRCRSTQAALSLAYYYANKDRMAAKSRAFRLNNAQRLDAYQALYRERHREKAKATTAAWKLANPERTKAAMATWYAANKDRVKVGGYEWRQANRETVTANHHRRRTRKRNAIGSWTAADVHDIRRMQRDRCAVSTCRAPLKGKGDVDHIVSLVNGGTNNRRNLQLLCHPCNCSKQHRDPIEFMQSRGLLI